MRVDEYRRMQARHASGGRFALLSRLPDSRNGEFTDAVGGATATSVSALWAYGTRSPPDSPRARE